jgi:hypothetical protein
MAQVSGGLQSSYVDVSAACGEGTRTGQPAINQLKGRHRLRRRRAPERRKINKHSAHDSRQSRDLDAVIFLHGRHPSSRDTLCA